MLVNIFVSTAEFCVVHQYCSCFAGENEIQLLSGKEKTAVQVGILQTTIQINSSLPVVSGYLQSCKAKPIEKFAFNTLSNASNVLSTIKVTGSFLCSADRTSLYIPCK
jgi:hypothetical protein